MNYFEDCLNITQAKTRFRELCKKHHPDVGGNAKTFADISNQYEKFKPSSDAHNNGYKSPHSGNSSSFGYGSTTSSWNTYSSDKFHDPHERSRNINIPFDHPIHQEISELKENIRKKELVLLNFKDQLSKLISENINLRLKLHESLENSLKMEEEIKTLKHSSKYSESFLKTIIKWVTG